MYIFFPEATGKRNAAQIAITSVGAMCHKPMRYTGNRFGEGLRNVSQGLLLARQKLALPGSLAASLEHTIGGTQSARVLSVTLRDAVVQRGVSPPPPPPPPFFFLVVVVCIDLEV